MEQASPIAIEPMRDGILCVAAGREDMRARAFYKAKGFTELGRVADYLPDGSAMVVFGKNTP